MKYKLYAQRVFSKQWQASTAFYEETIGLPVKFKDASMGWAEFDLGGASIAIEREDENSEESLAGRFVGISIQVEDITAIYQELTGKGVEFVAPPERQPWGGTLAHFKDPDGNVLTLLGE